MLSREPCDQEQMYGPKYHNIPYLLTGTFI